MTKQPHLRILVVEDNPQDLFLLRAALSRADLQDVELLHVERLADALRLLRQNPIDLILTDLSLPDSTGPETVRALAEHVDHIPIIVLTGRSDPDLERELRQHGASAMVSKDLLHTPTLAETIRNYALSLPQNRILLR